ncbi:hypothetical protein [Fodinicola feengrottensis]|nr:hypothetical protein [Fodinicola feengrottensis]
MATGDGLAASADGFRLAIGKTAGPLTFQILGTNGKPVTSFEVDQTKRMHFYLVRSDLTGFQHVHPEMAADGTWTANLATAAPGSYRAYASFLSAGKALVLSQPVSVPGKASAMVLPPPTTTTTVDGYTLTVDSPSLLAGMSHPLTVSVAREGKPVTDLQPYLDTYAHLTAFHAGDQAFAHLHPEGSVQGDHGGPKLTFVAMLPKSGDWRLFVQFQTGGRLRTAAITLRVR